MAAEPTAVRAQPPLPGDGEEMALRAEVLEIYHRAPGRDYVVMLVRSEHGVCRALGPAPAIVEKAQVLLTGRFRESPGGREYHFKTARVLAVQGAGLITLLAARFGISLIEAEAVARRLGPEAPSRLDADPALVEEVVEMPEATRRRLASALARGGGPARELLKRAGARDASINALVAAYGEGLSEALGANCYLPCLHADEPLATGDRIAQLSRRSTADNAPARVAAAIMERLRHAARAGHVTREDLDLSTKAEKLLKMRLAPEQFQAGLALLAKDARVSARGGQVALAEAAEAEIHLTEELKRLTGAPGERPGVAPARLQALARESGLALAEADLSQVAKAFACALLTLPLTLARHGPALLWLAKVATLLSAEVTVIVPTQQLKRLAQTLGHHVRHAREIGEDTRLAGDYVLVLEADRLSLPELLRLARAVQSGTSLWLAGDVRRLGGAPPGQVLRDLSDCKGVLALALQSLPDSEIAQGLKDLFRHGAPAHPSPGLTGRVHVIYGEGGELLEAARVTAQELLPALGYTNPGEVLFVCPAKQERADVNVAALNAVLGEAYRRAWPDAGCPCVLEGEVGEALRRGERGVLGPARGKRLRARFEDVETETFANQLAPGYCVSGHRAGGLLARCVVWVATESHGRLLSRELLFSAVSGAIERVILLTEHEALQRTLTTSQPERRTGWFADLARGAI